MNNISQNYSVCVIWVPGHNAIEIGGNLKTNDLARLRVRILLTQSLPYINLYRNQYNSVSTKNIAKWHFLEYKCLWNALTNQNDQRT